MSKTELYRALAEMAFAVAKADGGLQAVEKDEFFKILDEEIGGEAWSAGSRFELLQETLNPSVEHAYNNVMSTIKRSRASFTPDIQGHFIRVMERVAEAYNGIEPSERELIDRFLEDMEKLGK